MENLLLSASVVLPLLVIMLTGYVARRTRLLSESFFVEVNKLVYYIGLPALCLVKLSAADLANAFSDTCLLFVAGGIALTFLVVSLIVRRFCHTPSRRGVIIQAASRSNDAVFGLAVANALLPPSELSTIILVITVSIPVFNLFGILTLESNRGTRPGFFALLRRMIVNPILLACAGGLIINLLRLPLPAVLGNALSQLGNLVTPVAFLMLGGRLHFSALGKNRAALTAVVLSKLVLVPAVFVSLALLFRYPPAALISILAVFGAPTALASYPLACELGGDEELAGECVAVTSAFSLFTMFFFILALKSLGAI